MTRAPTRQTTRKRHVETPPEATIDAPGLMDTDLPPSQAITPTTPITVFLSAPLQLYGSPTYQAAVAYLSERYPAPTYRLLTPAGMWESNAHWRATYRAALADVTIQYLLPDADGFVGWGCLAEYEYLHDERGASCFVLRPDGVYRVARLDYFPDLPKSRCASAWAADSQPEPGHTWGRTPIRHSRGIRQHKEQAG